MYGTRWHEQDGENPSVISFLLRLVSTFSRYRLSVLTAMCTVLNLVDEAMEDLPEPRPLHQTRSLHIRNLPPSVTRAELIAVSFSASLSAMSLIGGNGC